jgi:hypothetical protein
LHDAAKFCVGAVFCCDAVMRNGKKAISRRSVPRLMINHDGTSGCDALYPDFRETTSFFLDFILEIA